jgi:hypothetical protein
MLAIGELSTSHSLNGPLKGLLKISKSDLSGLRSIRGDLRCHVGLDVLLREITNICRHPVDYEEHAQSTDGVGVTLDRLGRFVCRPEG